MSTCTSDRFCRNADGKALGFDLVVIEVDAVSLLRVPQMVQVKIAFASPVDPSSRLPQSVQNTREPIAAISCYEHRSGYPLFATLRLSEFEAFGTERTYTSFGQSLHSY